MAVILKSAKLNTSPAAAWGIVERFMRADVRVFNFIEENRIEGSLRTVVSGEGSLEQPEQNITTDPANMYASYTLLESPFWKKEHFHHGSMRVIDTGDGGCRFEWITDVSPDWLVETVLTPEYMDVLWSELRGVVETGVEAALPTATDPTWYPEATPSE